MLQTLHIFSYTVRKNSRFIRALLGDILDGQIPAIPKKWLVSAFLTQSKVTDVSALVVLVKGISNRVVHQKIFNSCRLL
jgi:hypothetical protein